MFQVNIFFPGAGNTSQATQQASYSIIDNASQMRLSNYVQTQPTQTIPSKSTPSKSKNAPLSLVGRVQALQSKGPAAEFTEAIWVLFDKMNQWLDKEKMNKVERRAKDVLNAIAVYNRNNATDIFSSEIDVLENKALSFRKVARSYLPRNDSPSQHHSSPTYPTPPVFQNAATQDMPGPEKALNTPISHAFDSTLNQNPPSKRKFGEMYSPQQPVPQVPFTYKGINRQLPPLPPAPLLHYDIPSPVQPTQDFKSLKRELKGLPLHSTNWRQVRCTAEQALTLRAYAYFPLLRMVELLQFGGTLSEYKATVSRLLSKIDVIKLDAVSLTLDAVKEESKWSRISIAAHAILNSAQNLTTSDSEIQAINEHASELLAEAQFHLHPPHRVPSIYTTHPAAQTTSTHSAPDSPDIIILPPLKRPALEPSAPYTTSASSAPDFPNIFTVPSPKIPVLEPSLVKSTEETAKGLMAQFEQALSKGHDNLALHFVDEALRLNPTYLPYLARKFHVLQMLNKLDQALCVADCARAICKNRIPFLANDPIRQSLHQQQYQNWCIAIQNLHNALAKSRQ